MALKVVRNEIDGWDVVPEDEDVALTNHPTREEAEAAARLRAEEESLSEPEGDAVVVAEREVHGIDDTRQGVRPAILALAGLLAAVTLLVIVLALTGSLTGFGS
jgi:hypothetical protein